MGQNAASCGNGLRNVEYFSIVFWMDGAGPHRSVGSVQDLRTGGRWFDPRLGKYSFRGLITGFTTGFIPLAAFNCFDNG